MSGVYAIVHKNSETMYIGATENDLRIRWNTHKCDLNGNRAHNSHLQAAWNKYGESAFEFLVLEETDDVFNHEQTWIDMAIMDGVCLYNQNFLVDIPYMLGRTHGKIAREKIRIAHTGRKHTREARENMRKTSVGNKSRAGQTQSKEERKKKGESLRRTWKIKQWNNKLKIPWIPFIRELYKRGIKQKDIAKICGVHPVTIGDACRYTTWRNI